MRLDQLETPAALVDLEIVRRNTARMAERMTSLGVRLRPHVKTHKCAEVARLQVEAHFGGITVSTLAEASFFENAGFRDVTYAFPFPVGRVEEAADLGRRMDALNLVVDHPATLRALEAFSEGQGARFSAFLKVDCGYHRAGVDPQRDESVALALALSRSPYVGFRGILTHAGHAYHSRSAQEIVRVAREERDVMVRFAEKLRRAGVSVGEVSVGSTPTMSVADDLDGVTEARPGNYAFYDGFQEAIGSCSLEDCAFSILVTIVGQYPGQNKLVVDGGSLAFSMDPGPRHVDPECGYGRVVAADANRPLAGLRLTSLSQEHGQVRGAGDVDFDLHGIGSRLRVIPNHSCLAAALFDRYHVVHQGEVVDEWRPVRGW